MAARATAAGEFRRQGCALANKAVFAQNACRMKRSHMYPFEQPEPKGIPPRGGWIKIKSSSESPRRYCRRQLCGAALLLGIGNDYTWESRPQGNRADGRAAPPAPPEDDARTIAYHREIQIQTVATSASLNTESGQEKLAQIMVSYDSIRPVLCKRRHRSVFLKLRTD